MLPLVPGYLAFLAGRRVAGRKTEGSLAPVAFFVLGFSVVFTLAFGLAASELSRGLRSSAGQRLAGLVVIGFGAFIGRHASGLSSA